MFLYYVIGAVGYLKVCLFENLGYGGGFFANVCEAAPFFGGVL
jgi:hypothetical protein